METDNCSICHLQIKKNTPVVWCPHCRESLCSSCEQQHRVMRLSRDHVTVPYEDFLKLPPLILNADLNCQEHNAKYQHFCRSHDVLCCEKCLFNSHEKCDDTPVINEIICNVKSSAGFEITWKELKETRETYKAAIESGENNLRQIEAKKAEFANRVKERTNRLIHKLKAIEDETLSVLESVVKETADKIDATNKTLRSKETILTTMIDQETSIKAHASDLQTFIGIKHIEKEIKEYQESLHKMNKNGDFSTWDVIMEDHDTIEKAIFGVKNLGNVKKGMDKATLIINVDQPNTAQVIVENRFPPQLNLTYQMKLENGNCYGCCVLPNGLMMFSDSKSEEIRIAESDGSLQPSVKFTGLGVNDVTIIGDNHIAVSNTMAATISIVEVDTRKVTTLQAKSKVRGITHYDGHIYFCVPGTGIMKINIESKRLAEVREDKSVDATSRIDTDGKRLCYTCYYQNTITVLDSDYKEIFVYKNDEILCGPRGITLDKHQNMFVCNKEKRNLLLISHNGARVEKFAEETGGLKDPSGVHY